jgi:methionyl-tRNA formyltransferase
VPDEFLALASTVAVNLHTGLLPFYRGTDLDFWPLYNDELDLLGVSVHKCTARIDGGEIFATRRVPLERDDGRFTVFPRQLAVGAPLYAQVIEQILREPPNGTQQDPDIGREYRMAMRGFLSEIVVRARIRRGLIRRYVDHENAAVRRTDRSS